MAARRKTRRKAPARRRAVKRRVVRRKAPVVGYRAPNIKKELDLIIIVGFALLFLYYMVF